MFRRDLGLEERSVRGSLVVGLSDKDIRLLDFFEGNVSANPLQVEEPLTWQLNKFIVVMVGIYTRTGSRPPAGSLGSSWRRRGNRSDAERSTRGSTSTK